jgi:hypothetical protein
VDVDVDGRREIKEVVVSSAITGSSSSSSSSVCSSSSSFSNWNEERNFIKLLKKLDFDHFWIFQFVPILSQSLFLMTAVFG